MPDRERVEANDQNENGDVRCPYDGQWVNVRCWNCGWERPSQAVAPDLGPAGPQVVGQPAANRLMAALDYRLSPGTRRLTRDQVAVVLHALADHTAIQAALVHRPDPSSPWPHATSMGRWFHDVGDQLDRQVEDARLIDPVCGRPWADHTGPATTTRK